MYKVHKFLVTIFLCLMFVVILNNNAYAGDVVVKNIPEFQTIFEANKSTYPVYILTCTNANSSNAKTYRLHLTKYNGGSVDTSNNRFFVDGPMVRYECKEGDTQWTNIGVVQVGQYVGGLSSNDDFRIVHANYNLHVNGTTVFRKAPTLKGAIVPRAISLSLLMDSIRLLMPCLILPTVLLLAFYKAFKWLKTQLMT